MIPEMLERETLLIGEENVKKIMNSSVAVFGVGGVGGYVVEGLVRAGIGHITIIDNDTVNLTNINRQIIADTTTVGMSKTDAALLRARKINPNIQVDVINEFITSENAVGILEKLKCGYIADAIDTVSAKLAIAEFAYKNKINIISSMGTGNKLDPTRLRIGDIYKTSVCPLARVMRRELRVRGVSHLNVLWSDEEPVKNQLGEKPVIKGNGRNAPGSISFVPSVGGLLIAAHIINDIIN